MHRSILFLILLSFSMLAVSGTTGATTLVSENFNNQSYSSPLKYYNVDGYDKNMVYNSVNARGGVGYCLRFDHSSNIPGLYGSFSPAYAGIGVLSNPGNYVANGIYIRYYVKYSSEYLWPEDLGFSATNLKVCKFFHSGGPGYDIEIIHKQSQNGPGGGFIQRTEADGKTHSVYPSYPTKMANGQWHKIELYFKINSSPNSSCIHYTLDDNSIYDHCDVNLSQPASSYDTMQFMSLRAEAPSGSGYSDPGDGHGFYYTDDVTIVTGEGDLSNNEPPEPSTQASSAPLLSSPTIKSIIIK